MSRSLLQEHGYRNTVAMGKLVRRRGTGLWRVSSPAQGPVSVAETQRNFFVSARDLKAANGFPGQKTTLITRLKEEGLRARHAAVKKLLTDENKLYRFSFAESNVDRKWDRVIFSDESALAQQMIDRL